MPALSSFCEKVFSIIAKRNSELESIRFICVSNILRSSAIVFKSNSCESCAFITGFDIPAKAPFLISKAPLAVASTKP